MGYIPHVTLPTPKGLTRAFPLALPYLELELALDGEVFDGKVIFPVVGETLVEVSILLLGNVVGVPRPDWLSLVQLLVWDGEGGGERGTGKEE